MAMTKQGVIGLDGTVPWHYSEDLKRFKRTTLNSTVIMGRKTWESLPFRPLPQRRNIVITSNSDMSAESYPSINKALQAIDDGQIWFIGGAQIYQESIQYCDTIDLTHVPDTVSNPRSVLFPSIDWSVWNSGPKVPFASDPRLFHQQFTRISDQ